MAHPVPYYCACVYLFYNGCAASSVYKVQKTAAGQRLKSMGAVGELWPGVENSPDAVLYWPKTGTQSEVLFFFKVSDFLGFAILSSLFITLFYLHPTSSYSSLSSLNHHPHHNTKHQSIKTTFCCDFIPQRNFVIRTFFGECLQLAQRVQQC